jgi:hypothetical protein
LIKQDINFLEYPIWIQDKYNADKKEAGYIWKDREGYLYRAGYKPPVKTDFIFLLYFLMKSQIGGWVDRVELTKYEIVKACGMNPSKEKYDRIEDSLKRWEMVKLQFEGTFYDGVDYQTLHFGIIDSWGIEKETKKLKIRFSPEWLLKIKESNFFKLLNFEQIKTLRSALVIRIYEILIKNFQGRTKWEIDSQKLAEKIPMKEQYPADIIPKIQAAVNRISNHTDQNIKLTIKRPDRGKAIFIFEKLPDITTKKLPTPEPTPEHQEDCRSQNIIDLLPPEHQSKKTILDEISRGYQKHGFDFVARNIKYTNKKSTGNYRAYLHQALKNDWGLALEEDDKIKQEQHQKNKKETERQDLEIEKTQKSMEQSIRAQEYIDKLSIEELEILKQEAIPRMSPTMVKHLESGNKIGQSNLRTTMQAIVIEKGLIG